MPNRPAILLIAAAAPLSLLLTTGCGRTTDGMRILDDLRREGLIVDHDDGPAPAPAAPRPRGLDPLPEGDVTLAMLLEAADRLNPRIAAARSRIGAAGGEAWQADLYPNPTLLLESENVRPSNGGFGVSETTVGVAQPIIVSDRREAAVSAGRARVDARRWELQRVRREVHGRVRRVATEIAYYQRAIVLHEELRELAEQTSTIARTRFQARAAPESEAIRAQVEANRLGLTIERLDGELAAAGERLDTLLGGQHVDVERIDEESLEAGPSHELRSLDHLRSTVGASHPAVLAGEAEVEAARRQVELQRARRYPDITARLGAGVDHDDDEGFLEAGVGVPLPIYDGNQGNILAARFDVIRATQDLKATTDELSGAIAQAYYRWQSAATRLAVFEEQILDGARRSCDQAREGYQAGKLPFLDLLDAQRTLIEATVAGIELERSVDLGLADIYSILGYEPITGTSP